MPTTTPSSQSEILLAELASLSTIERGTLTEEFRHQPAADGSGTVRKGPYYKHQCWENGRNRSTRVALPQVTALREDLQRGQRFDQITSELASIAIEEGRSRRAALGSASPETSVIQQAAKKNSRRNASRKDTAKRKRSSPPSASTSAGRKRKR